MRYFCKNQERRLKVINSPAEEGLNAMNGIDYLEVVSVDQKTLEVHFLHPLPGQAGGIPDTPALSSHNIMIEGGIRVKNIKALSVAAANGVLTVQVDNSGDFSMYTFRLVASPVDNETPEGFDEQLSAVAFSFKANCPTDFDCKTKDFCPDDTFQEPRIDYLAKDFASFRKQMLDRLSLLMPDWTERNAADLQVALVELLAYTGDYLSYYQDAVATEAYLFKARKRVSARRHARLLDYHVHNGCNARTWVAFEVESGSASDTAILPKNTRLLTRGRGNEVRVGSTELDKKLKERDVVVFETLEEIRLIYARNRIDFYTWDDTGCCLPRGAVRATLYSKDQDALFLLAGQVLILEEITGPATGREADADPLQRHAVRLTRVTEKTDILHGIKVTEVEWHEEDALPFPLCISATINGKRTEGLSVARGNVVLADHGITVEGKKLLPDAATGHGMYYPLLPDTGVTVSIPYDPVAADKKPASRMLHQDPHQAIPCIELREGHDIWRANRDLLASNRFATEFVAEIESDLSTRLRFGDGIMGRIPGQGFRPQAKYRIGSGLVGNIGAGAIGRVVWDQAGILSVRNPLPATGGKKPETLEEVRQFAPEAFRTQERAVTEADYVAKTELYPQVKKALARFRWTGSWHTVFLTIDRKGGLVLDNSFREEIINHLEKYRMAGYDLEICPPVLVPLEVEMNVCVKPGYFRSHVEERLLVEFSRYLLPDGRRGFFHPDEFTFGQAVYMSAAYQRALDVEGVDSVEVKTFKRHDRPANREIENGLFQPGESEIIILYNDPNYPEYGKINFLMFGGL